MKKCSQCGRGLLLGVNWTEGCERNRTYTCSPCRAAYQRSYHQENREARLKKQKERYAATRDAVLEKCKYYQIKKKYNLTKEEYIELMEGSVCSICAKDTDLCVDHNHDTGEVRGVLCRQCNAGIGLLKDSTKLLTKALEYLTL